MNQGKTKHSSSETQIDSDETDSHRNAPTPDPACLYGLVGEVAMAGSKGNESNPFAIALNYIAYLSCAIGRGTFLQIGNTEHHSRIFSLHVGRSGRGRKGDSIALVIKIDEFIRGQKPLLCPQIHRGGLSSREGLAALIHDDYLKGSQEVPGMNDKRLWVVESEFANVLQQSKRKGNTLSTALRDCWDGVCIKPATKNNRVFASNPHVCLSGAITPNELTALMSSKDLSNGFANRFLIIWAERTKITAFPQPTSDKAIEYLATRTQEVLNFAKADEHLENNWLQIELSPAGKWHYGQMYRNVLAQDFGSERISAILERRAPAYSSDVDQSIQQRDQLVQSL
jgi:putative DNA primase/helicase